MIYTKNNYLKTYGSGDAFRSEIDLSTSDIIDFHTATLNAVEEIYSKKKGTLYLMYSGGVDSEYLLQILINLGIDVTPVIVKLTPRYNEHDVRYAFNFCESKKLSPVVIDIDFDDFVKKGKILDIAFKSECGAYQLPSTFHAVSQLDGTVIMGSHGPSHISKIDNDWFVDEMQCNHSVLTWFEKNNIYGFPFVLAYTAEQYYSFLRHPLMLLVAQNKFSGRKGSNFIKGEIYNDLSGYNLEPRKKFTGYEHIERREIFQHENMQWFLTEGKKWYGIHYQEYFSFLNRNILNGS